MSQENDRTPNDDRGYGVVHLEIRLQRMEDRMQKLEIDIITRMEAMTAAWQNLEKAVQGLTDKVVTRSEFDVVKIVTILTAIGLVAWIMYRRGILP